jgi:ADP-heptose:LPS heptosyltransferase
LDSHPALTEILLYPRTKGIFTFLPFLQEIRRREFDFVLDLQRHAKSGVVSWWSRAPVRLGFHRTNTKEGNWLFNTHTIAPIPDFSLKLGQYLQFAQTLQLPDDEVRFDLRLRPAEEQQVEKQLADTVPLCVFFLARVGPAASGFRKRLRR